MRWRHYILGDRYSRGGYPFNPCQYDDVSPREKANSLTQREAPLRLLNKSGEQSTLFLSMFRLPESGDERQAEALDSQILEAQPDHPRLGHSNPMSSQWDTALRQLYRLFKIFDPCSVQFLHNQRGFDISCDVQLSLLNVYRMQGYIYSAYQVPSCVLIPSASG